jgi:hypothetical protein
MDLFKLLVEVKILNYFKWQYQFVKMIFILMKVAIK